MSEPIKLFKPSSGMHGEWFIRNWCGQCERDKCQNGSKEMDACGDEDLCQILGNTMLYAIDEPGYPKEWRYDADGDPVCTAFLAIGNAVPVIDDKTLDLFEEQP